MMHFLVARDLGHEALMRPKGLETLISRIPANLFPRATEETRELFRAGQRQGGVLSRQSGESMHELHVPASQVVETPCRVRSIPSVERGDAK